MTSKITLGMVGVVLILSVYNTVQISQIEREGAKTFLNNGHSSVQNSSNSGNPVNNPAPQANSSIPVIPNNPLEQKNPSGPTTSIKFKDEVHDFGSVDVDTENAFAFEFKNTGTEPLIISNAKGSCGCTVPNWPKTPIKPNETATIDVIYRPNKGQAGMPQEKTVTVTANTEPANTIVKIKAFVNPEK